MKKESLHNSSIQRKKQIQPFFRKRAISGPQADTKKSKARKLQSKGHPQEDPHERQADQVADQVVSRKGDNHTTNLLCKQITPLVPSEKRRPQLVPEEEYRGSAAEVQCKTGAQQTSETASGLKATAGTPPDSMAVAGNAQLVEMHQEKGQLEHSSEVNTTGQVSRFLTETAGGGHPIPERYRIALEQQFGADFTLVRVHTDAPAERMSKLLGAQAFASGTHIFFNRGRFEPATTRGLHLLAHELTHTIQQGAIKPKPTSTRSASVPHREVSAQEGSSVTAEVSVPKMGLATPDRSTAEAKAGPAVEPKAAEATSAELPAPAPDAAEKLPEAVPVDESEDQQHQAIVDKLKQTALRQKKKEESLETKKGNIVSSSVMSTAREEQRSAYEPHLTLMESQTKVEGKKEFTKADFIHDFSTAVSKVAEELPKSWGEHSSINNTMDRGRAERDAYTAMRTQNQDLSAPLRQEAKKPEPSAVSENKSNEVPAGQRLIPEEAGKRPYVAGAETAAPKPKPDPEISLDAESKKLDNVMSENKVTEAQLANSREPQFMEALADKQQAQEEVAKVPSKYRQEENVLLEGAQANMKKTVYQSVGKMYGKRDQVFGSVGKKQQDKKQDIQTKKEAIFKEFQRIYEDTRKDVDTALKPLQGIEQQFLDILEIANKNFKKNITGQMEYIYTPGMLDYSDWDEEAESEIREVARKEFSHLHPLQAWSKALKTVQDRHAEAYFQWKKERYIEEVYKGVGEIADIVVKALNTARTVLSLGLQSAVTYKESFTGTEAEFANEAFGAIKLQFDNLETTINDSRKEVINTMAQAYKKELGKLRETFDKIKEEALTSWLEKAYNKVKAVVKAIAEFASRIGELLGRLFYLVGDIVAHPIRFFENLCSGIKQAFSTFTGDPGKYLSIAFFDWLRGKGPPIQIPTQLDGSGLFSLFAQLLNITEDFFWERVGKKFSKKVVNMLRKGEAMAEKGLEIFTVIRTKGIMGIWEHIKHTVGNMLGEMLTQLKEMILFQTIRKALAKIGKMFIPGGGFLAIAGMVVDALKFLFNNRDRILDLIEAFVDGVEMAVKGDIGGIVSRIIRGLTNFITLAIDFLARLFGLGDLNNKLQNLLNRIRKPIARGIDFVLDKAKAALQRVLRSGGKAAKKIKERVLNWWKARKSFKANDGTSHSLYFTGKEKSATLMLASKPRKYASFIRGISTSGKSNAFAEAKTKALAIAEEIDQLIRRGIKEEAGASKVQTKLNALAKHTAILAAERPKSPPSVVKYGSLNDQGSATSMEASILSNNINKGGAPNSNTAIWKMARRRRSVSGSVSEYVQGHLLNHLLGGPGRAYNLAPITRSANGLHDTRVETPVYNEVIAGKVVTYSVKVTYGRHPQRTYQKELKAKGAGRTGQESEKYTLLNYEQKYMPKAFKCSWQLLNYDETKAKWSLTGKRYNETIKVVLPDDHFEIN